MLAILPSRSAASESLLLVALSMISLCSLTFTHSIPQGDIIFCDPLEGIVVIPKDLAEDLIELMPELVRADDKVKEDVLAGSGVFESFKKHRG